MDLDRMKKWLDFAKEFQHGQFWDSVFDKDYTEKIMEQFTQSSAPPKPLNNSRFPLADIFKNNREFIIVLDLPGTRKEDIEISIADYSLNVRGVVKPRNSGMSKVQTERFSGEFERTITLPELVGGTNISAKFDNGIIEIRIPRSHRSKEKIIIE
ncbi:Hsp20/alpha crystallin family protein [Paenibacillus elgii]